MASTLTSLNKLGVPTAANETVVPLMPKLQYRFRVAFTSFGASTDTKELTRQIVTCSRPKVDFDQGVLDMYNSRIKYAGKPKWNPITITIRDDVTGAVSKLVGQQLQKQFDFAEQSSSYAGSNYKFSLAIEILDGGNGANAPTVLESFDLAGCYIASADYKEGDYKTSEPMTITLTVEYDNALQKDQSNNFAGIGSALVTAATSATGTSLATG